VAQASAQEGARVSLCSRTEADVVAAAERIRTATQSETLATACDVLKAADIENWVQRTISAWGQVDALLVNAGGPPSASFKELTDEQWQAAFELTLMSTVRMIRAVLPYMPHGSAILTVTSSSIIEPIPRLGLSTVMRAGVAGLVKTLANELAADGIRVNNLIPGRIDTERVAQLDAGVAKRLNITPEEARAQSLQNIPLKRIGSIEEFGRAATFLLSPAASFITGATLRVDGGQIKAI
jgi:3-oxoacyl-[acyl-carrier protein] reductase